MNLATISRVRFAVVTPYGLCSTVPESDAYHLPRNAFHEKFPYRMPFTGTLGACPHSTQKSW
jgi:hypothetical protein